MKILKNLPLFALIVFVGTIAFKLSEKAKQPEQSSSKHIGTVIKVADGDTITLDIDGTKERIRLCGIDAPERSQPLGKESGDHLRKMVLNKQVAITEIEKDRFGRTVAEVFVLGSPERFVNGDMVVAGLAYHYAQFSQKCPNRNVIVDSEAIAKGTSSGVWGISAAVKPWDYRRNK